MVALSAMETSYSWANFGGHPDLSGRQKKFLFGPRHMIG
jgi:hypothetical protein